MKNTSDKTTKGGLTVQTAIKAGGLQMVNHNVRGLKVHAGVKAGGWSVNHNVRGLKVRARREGGRPVDVQPQRPRPRRCGA